MLNYTNLQIWLSRKWCIKWKKLYTFSTYFFMYFFLGCIISYKRPCSFPSIY